MSSGKFCAVTQAWVMFSLTVGRACRAFALRGLRVTAYERPSFSAYAGRTPMGELLGFFPAYGEIQR